MSKLFKGLFILFVTLTSLTGCAYIALNHERVWSGLKHLIGA